ncbi:MAG: hypothetical protein CMJ49_00615 [Planctomycetaceae bacterium]|nr:hypothetical protein [Planctomycetaceae bacterium]
MSHAVLTSDPPHVEPATDWQPTIGILGGPLDAANLGVAALGYGAIKGVCQAFEQPRILCQSWDRDQPCHTRINDRDHTIQPLMLHPTRNLRARTGVRQVRILARLARLIGRPMRSLACRINPTLDQLLRCDVVLDVSGGDSFADIYGPERFMHHAQFKLLTLELGKPLILLPQTFGPFQHQTSRDTARSIIERAALAATREHNGLAELEELFDGHVPDHVVACPDMAFQMDPDGSHAHEEPLARKDDDNDILIGLNVSELLYRQGEDFALAAPYRDTIHAAIDWALSHPHVRVMLVPHVLALSDDDHDDTSQWQQLNQTSDTTVCRTVLRDLTARYGERIGCLGGPYTAPQIKYFIGQCDFFIGARMHACIAAISQCIPTAVMAYSKKAAGVMERIGVGEVVTDLRQLSPTQCASKLGELFDQRHEIHHKLTQSMPHVIRQIEQFFTRDFRAAMKRIR